MLFLYRPRQTWMPYRVPRGNEQVGYNRSLQAKFDATRRVAPPEPAAAGSPPMHDTVAQLKDLAQLRASGALDDEEFEAAKAKVLGRSGGSA
jgi:Short C-terminal domain